MGTSTINLPEGFVLDDPSTTLPEGFVLDKPTSQLKSRGATGTWEDKTNILEPPINLRKILPHNKFVDDTLRNTQELGIELGLAGAGGEVGAASGPAAPFLIPLLSGAGYAAGKRLNQIGRGETMTLPESFLKAGQDTANAATMNTLVGAAVNKAGDWLSKRRPVNPTETLETPDADKMGKIIAGREKYLKSRTGEIANLKKQAEELGVNLTPSDITENDILLKIENTLRGFYGSGGQFRKEDIANTQALINQYKAFLSKGIPESEAVSIQELGNKIKKDVDDIVARQGDIKNRLLNQARNNVLKRLGSPLSYEQLGKSTQEAIEGASGVAKEGERALYTAVGERLPKVKYKPPQKPSLLTGEYSIDLPEEEVSRGMPKAGELVPKQFKASNLQKTANDILKKINIGEDFARNDQIKTLEEYASGKPYSWNTLEGERRALRDFGVSINQYKTSQVPGTQFGIKAGEGQNYRIANALVDAINKDQGAFAKKAKDPQIYSDFLEAKATAALNRETYGLNNKLIQKMIHSQSPSEVVDYIKTAEDVDMVKNAIGEGRFNKIVKPAITNRIMGVASKDIFDPSYSKKQINKVNTQILSKIYNHRELAEITDMVDKGIDFTSRPLSRDILKTISDTQAQEGYTIARSIFKQSGRHLEGNLKKLWAVSSPENRGLLKRQLTIELFTGNQPASAISQMEAGAVTPELIGFSGRAFDKSLKNFLPILKTYGYNERDIGLLRKIAYVSSKLQGVERMSMNPSRTARTIAGQSQGIMTITGATSALGALFTGHPMAALGAAAGSAATITTPYLFAKAYLSPIGRKVLTEGFSIPAGTPQAAAWLSKLTYYASMEEDKGTQANQPEWNKKNQ